jgi:hypothetical protein
MLLLLKNYKGYFLVAELGKTTLGHVCGRIVVKNFGEICP